MKKITIIAVMMSLVLLPGCIARVEQETEEDTEIISALETRVDELEDELADVPDISEYTDRIKELEGRLAEIVPVETLIEPADDTIKVNTMTLLEEYIYDIDGDSSAETISLFTTAVMDDRGRMMWDDGHNFVLLLTDGDNEYLLYDGYVQLGRIYFMVYEGGTSGIVSMVSTYSGVYMEKYSFREDGSMYKVTLYDTGSMNIVHSTMPWD